MITTSICPFCDGSINKAAFYESDNFLIIYNHAPILPGHSLVIPRIHIESILQLSPALRSELMEISCKGINMLMKVFSAKAFDWTIQEGSEAGQSIPHLHLHLIPRKENDLQDPGDWYPKLKESMGDKRIDSCDRPKYSLDEIIKIVEFIKSSNSLDN